MPATCGVAMDVPDGVTRTAGNDVATGGRNLRLELEIGRDTPRGEVGRPRGLVEAKARPACGLEMAMELTGLDGILASASFLSS